MTAAVARFGTLAPRLAAQGFEPVPIIPGRKWPRPKAWDQGGWAERAGEFGDDFTGILARSTPGIDIDVSDPELVREIEAIVLDVLDCHERPPPARTGMPPRKLLVCRTEEPFSKLTTAGYALPNDPVIDGKRKLSKVEILADGQQFVAYAVHPDTRAPYTWSGTGDPLNIQRADLVHISEEQAREIIRRAGALLAQQAGAVPKATKSKAEPPLEMVDAATVTDLRSALNALNPDDRLEWTNNAHRLIRVTTNGQGAAAGRELWWTWSQQSQEKFDPVDAARVWKSVKPDGSTGYAAVFKAAQAAGWVNPRSKAAQVPAGAATAGEAPSFALVPVDDLDAADIEPQSWAWDHYIPAGEVTLLGAHGGTGKSMVSMMLAVATPLGLPLFGVPTTAAPVVFFSAEDGAVTVRRRLQTITRAMGVSAADLNGRLIVIDATRTAPELACMTWQGDGNGGGRQSFGLTILGGKLRDFVATLPAPLLIVDNASDAFGGNENARPEVRAFVRLLAGMVRDAGGAVLLLGHLDKSGARGFGSGENYSGSTAWHNSARSRLYLSRDKDGALMLEHQKSNHGPMREPLRLVWPKGGLPVVDAFVTGFVQDLADESHTKALLKLIAEFTGRGEFVSTATTSRTHAGKLLRNAPGFPPRLPDGDLFELLRAAERKGLLARLKYPGADRHARERWEVTPKGRSAAGLAATAATAATSEVNAVHAVAAGESPEPAATAGTSPHRGCGGNSRRTKSPQTVDAEAPHA